MRSLENLDHGNVFVVGEKPIFLTSEVIHIPAKDRHENKLKNALEKQIIVANDPRLSSEFILMNDDFFIMEPTAITPLHLGRIDDALLSHETKGGYYYHALALVQDMIRFFGVKNPINYEAHIPITYDKKKFLRLAERLDAGTEGYLMRSLYGNFYGIGGHKIKDVKVYSQWKDWDGGTFLSVDDVVTRRESFQAFLQKAFPHPSIYENNLHDTFRKPKEIERDYCFIRPTVWNGRQYNMGDITRTAYPTVHMKPIEK
jgi:hypothetical protein